MLKVCPEGKILNPKTNRCIKKKFVDINKNIINNLKILQEYTKINKDTFKSNAYSKAVDTIELFEKQIETEEDVKNIKGIGVQILSKIKEYLKTGKIEAVEKAISDPKYILCKKLLNIYGIGPVKAEELFEKIKDFDELYLDKNKALLNEKQKIGLNYYKDLQTRIPYTEGKKHYKIIQKTFTDLYKNIEFEMVGSYRRKNKDMGDIDILIKNDGNIKICDMVSNLKERGYIIETLASGKNKFMGICRISPDIPARRIDMLIAEPDYYYFALLYFTGSYNFNIYMRKIALSKGMSLSEYGIKDNTTKAFIDTRDVIKNEEDIFKYLEIPYIVPNKR